jgi:hypothetical protein
MFGAPHGSLLGGTIPAGPPWLEAPPGGFGATGGATPAPGGSDGSWFSRHWTRLAVIATVLLVIAVLAIVVISQAAGAAGGCGGG